MYKLKSILAILVIALLLFVTPAFAQARYSLKVSVPIETSTALVLPAGTWVYGVKVYADANSSWAALYDVATIAGADADETTRKEELGEATQYDSVEIMYETPIYYTNGVTVKMTTGICFIYYGAEPGS